MHFVFIFIDGIGLGPNDPSSNPFARSKIPNLISLIGNHKIVLETLSENGNPLISQDSTFLGLDANLGIKGHPQSATGQATILTGINVPKKLGMHFGPWPNEEIRTLLRENSIFKVLQSRGFKSQLLNAYPQSYFDRIQSGRRLPGAVAMSVLDAGIKLKTTEDLIAGQALSADFTGEGWHNRINNTDIPIITLADAGKRIVKLGRTKDFSFFEFWISDYAGHRADMNEACALLENFDIVIGNLISNWDPSDGLIFITSDHGNLENTKTRGHTRNLVPGIIIGKEEYRNRFSDSLSDLSDISPAILKFYE